MAILTATEEDFHGMHIFPLRGDGQIMSEIFYAKKFSDARFSLPSLSAIVSHRKNLFLRLTARAITHFHFSNSRKKI